MLKRTKYCFLITHGDGGWCTARIVEPIVEEAEDFTLWFGTNRLLRKVREIEADPHVTVAVENERENANLVLYGTATIVREQAVRQQRWVASWRMFFPRGPKSRDYVVIRFEAQRVELMNFTRNVIPEPFGLRPLVLLKREGGWDLAQPYESPAEENPI
jgi:general stress protein 26